MVDRVSRSPDTAKPGPRSLALLALSTALVLGAAPASAVAAAGWALNCDKVARDLQDRDIVVDALTVEIADHMTDDRGVTDAAASHVDATAPLLFLTPRVVHILEDVFGDAGTTEISPLERVRRIVLAANAASPAMEEPSGEQSADRGDTDEATADRESATVAGPVPDTFEDGDTLPRFQRQMYRTDI